MPETLTEVIEGLQSLLNEHPEICSFHQNVVTLAIQKLEQVKEETEG